MYSFSHLCYYSLVLALSLSLPLPPPFFYALHRHLIFLVPFSRPIFPLMPNEHKLIEWELLVELNILWSIWFHIGNVFAMCQARDQHFVMLKVYSTADAPHSPHSYEAHFIWMPNEKSEIEKNRFAFLSFGLVRLIAGNLVMFPFLCLCYTEQNAHKWAEKQYSLHTCHKRLDFIWSCIENVVTRMIV